MLIYMRKYLLMLLTCVFISVGVEAQQRHFTIADGLHNNQVRQIVELPNGQMLVSNEGAFSLYDGNRFQPVYCCLDSIYQLPSFGCHDYMWVSDSVLMLKDYYCIYLFDTSTMSFRYDYTYYIIGDKVKAFIDSDKRTRSMECVDRQGGRWQVDEMNGIIYHSPVPARGHVILLDALDANDHVRHMTAVSDNDILMASADGIYVYDTQSGSVKDVLYKGQVHSSNINSGSDGTAWVSTKQGLFRYAGGKLEQFNTSNTSGFLHDHMRFAYAIDNKRVLVCNLLHLLGYLYPEEGRFVLLNNDLPELNSYRTMIDACPLDDDGRILVATQNGTFVLNTRTDKIEHPSCLNGIAKYSNKFNCLLRDSHNRVWIGSQNGLFVLIPQLSSTGKNRDYVLRHLSSADGLSNTCIKTLAEDSAGNIFVGTAFGLNKIAIGTDDMNVTAYGVSDGVPELEICERGMCMMPHGLLYFSTDKNMIVFDVETEYKALPPLCVRLVGVGVNDSLWALCPKLNLRYDQNNITLRFSALNYANPSHTHYRYRLVGISNTWTHVRDGRDIVVAQYHSLPSGTYSFEIQAAVDNGSWGKVTSLPIVINPPLWLTWWAILIYVIVVILISAKSIGLYLSHRRKVMEAENEMRVNKLFELQSEARHQFAQNTNVSTENLSDRANEDLVARMNKAIADNMDNTDYTVDHLASDVGMSRASLYKKAQQALGITPNEYLRNVRLKHATTLLEQGIPVNQVSLMVGFVTPRYFSQCFKSLFGVTPSEYGASDRKDMAETNEASKD